MQVIDQNGLPQKYKLSSQLNLSGRILRNGAESLSRAHLVNENVSHFQLRNITLPDFQSADGSFSSGHLIEVEFNNALFSETVFRDLTCLRATFRNCFFGRAQFENCLFIDCVFESQNPNDAVEDIHFHECLFLNCDPKALGKSTLHNCLFENKNDPQLVEPEAITPASPKVISLPEKSAATAVAQPAGRFSALER